MRKTFFGAALFFIGLGIFLSVIIPVENWFLSLCVSVALMCAGYKIGSCGC